MPIRRYWKKWRKVVLTQNTTFIAVFKQAGKPFEIGYDTLGYGSNLSVDFECTSEVLTNATVTFTLTLVDLSAEFEDYDPLKISRDPHNR